MLNNFSVDDQDTVVDILTIFQEKYPHLGVPLVAYEQLAAVLSARQIKFLAAFSDGELIPEAVLQADDFVTPELDADSKQFVRLSKPVFRAYTSLAAALAGDTGQTLSIVSGYRSPWYQILLVLAKIYETDFDVALALRQLKMPSESQHSAFPHHALDITVADNHGDKKISTNFSKTSAYKWLLVHAADFGFYQPYPEHNTLHTMFEPWHWCYQGTNQAIA